MGFAASESCWALERSCQSIPLGPPPPPRVSFVYINRAWSLESHTDGTAGNQGKMPASPAGFGNFFLERNLVMPPGYQVPVLGPPSALQQQQQHLAAMAAGVPISFSGLQGYNFIPYPHHRHIAHTVSHTKKRCLKQKMLLF